MILYYGIPNLTLFMNIVHGLSETDSL